MFTALSDLKPSAQLGVELWNKAELKSFTLALQPPEPPAEEEMPPPEGKLKASVMSQASKQTERPSYYTYLNLEELHPMDVARPDRNLHDYGEYRINGFLRAVARRPQQLEEKVIRKRGKAAWWSWL